MEFWRIYRLVFAKRWLIAAIMLISAVVILIGATLQAQKKSYQATTVLRPSRSGQSTVSGGQAGPERVQTISDLISMLQTSPDLRKQTARLLAMGEEQRITEVQKLLEKNSYFAQIDAQEVRPAVLAATRNTPAKFEETLAQAEKEKHLAYAREFARATDEDGSYALRQRDVNAVFNDLNGRIDGGGITFEAVESSLSTEKEPKYSNLLRVRTTSARAAEAQLYVNMLAVAFLDFYTQISNADADRYRAQLTQLSKTANTERTRAKNALLSYQKANPDVALSSEQANTVANAAKNESRRDDLLAQIRSAAAQRDKFQQLMLQTQANRTESVALPIEQAPAVVDAQRRVNEANYELERIDRAGELGRKSPQWIAAEATLTAAKTNLRTARDQASKNYNSTSVLGDYNRYRADFRAQEANLVGLRANLVEVERQLSDQRAKRLKLPQAQADLSNLLRDVEIRDNLARGLETKLAETQIQKNNNVQDAINLLGTASVSQIGADLLSQRWKLMAYGAILAMIFGVALVVAMDALDNSIRSSADVEKLLGLPICGIIPAQLPDPARAPKITYLDPLSPVAESYRLLRTNLLFTAEETPFKSLMLSTGKPGQGATTTVCNLAIALAQAGKRVILVDADLRRPKLHNIFRIKNDVGLTSLLNNDCEIEEALKVTEIDNLLILPSGPLPLNPSELLASPRMKALHEQLKPHTDFVLFDTPSAIAFSDATVLSSFLDATLIVVRANNVPRGSEEQVRTMLNKAKANILGVVLNGVDPEHVDSVHYHYHYYPLLTTRGPVGALNGSQHNGSNGHHNGHGGGTPLALPDGSSDADPFSTPRGGSTTASSTTGTATLPTAAATTGERTQSFHSPAASGANTYAAEPFLEARPRNRWKRMRGALLYIAIGILVGLLVLALFQVTQQTA